MLPRSTVSGVTRPASGIGRHDMAPTRLRFAHALGGLPAVASLFHLYKGHASLRFLSKTSGSPALSNPYAGTPHCPLGRCRGRPQNGTKTFLQTNCLRKLRAHVALSAQTLRPRPNAIRQIALLMVLLALPRGRLVARRQASHPTPTTRLSRRRPHRRRRRLPTTPTTPTAATTDTVTGLAFNPDIRLSHRM